MKKSNQNIQLHKIILIVFILFLGSFHCKATVYTFQTAGDYTDASNWDTYPGTDLGTNDTISIEANCSNINLYASDGYVVFSEYVSDIQIVDLFTTNNCQLEFKASWFQLYILGDFHYTSNYPIIFSDNAFIFIINSGNGIYGEGAQSWESIQIDYINLGNQDVSLLESIEGHFVNEGILNVDWLFVFLNCDLDLSTGTIEGTSPFTFYQFGGSISQDCTSCTATINNIENLYLNQNVNIRGTLILNSPE